MVWDAFTIAFKAPNLFRRLFGEGALSAAFVPVFTEYLAKNSKEEARELTRSLGTVLLIILASIVIVGESLFYLLPKIIDLAPKWQMVFDLLLIMFPYVIFICMVALSMAILNSLKHFLFPTLSPIVLNVFWISGVVLASTLFKTDLDKKVYCVAFAILLAGIVQLAMQLPVLRKHGMGFNLTRNISHPAIKQIFKLMGPSIIGLAIVQINVMLDGIIAIGFAPPAEDTTMFTLFGMDILFPLQTGAASVLYFSDRLIQFPLGVFGIALASVIFPLFSTHAAHEDWKSFKSTFNHAVRLILFIGIPASVGLILLRLPLVQLFYERNAFNVESTTRTINVVLFYSIGIWAYCGLHVIVRAFYSLKDTKTPMKIGLCMVGLNLILNLSLIWVFKAGGLAFATSISAIVQLIVLFAILKKRLNMPFLNQEMLLSFSKTCLATVIMALSCIWTYKAVSWMMTENDIISKLVRLSAPLSAALITFFITAYLVKSDELRSLIKTKKS